MDPNAFPGGLPGLGGVPMMPGLIPQSVPLPGLGGVPMPGLGGMPGLGMPVPMPGGVAMPAPVPVPVPVQAPPVPVPAPAPAVAAPGGFGSMKHLYQHVPAAGVSEAFKQQAHDWPEWDSTEEPPSMNNKFHFTYEGDHHSERAFVLKGHATLTPDDGSPPVDLKAGDAVYLNFGFACTWEVHEPMTTKYGYFGPDGKEIETTDLTCDICGADCWEESWHLEEEDICPK